MDSPPVSVTPPVSVVVPVTARVPDNTMFVKLVSPAAMV